MAHPYPLEAQNELLALAAENEGDAWQDGALALLSHSIGFDGAVWGWGHLEHSGQFTMDDVEVWQRDPALVQDYQTVASEDPVTQGFLRAPTQLQVVDCASFYRRSGPEGLQEILEHHRIAHLALIGIQPGRGHRRLWITLYREDVKRPFDMQKHALLEGLLPMALTLGLLRGHRAPTAPERLHTENPAPTLDLAACTPRELAVVRSYASGLSYKEVARSLAMSPATVRTHLRNSYRKLGVDDKARLANLVAGDARTKS